MLSRKASLELSVNSIVILILAIVILGLGIGFIKNMFEKTTSQIGDINKDAEKRMLESIKDSPDRLVVDPDNLEIAQGKERDVYFGLRNELDAKQTFFINGAGKLDTTNNPGDWIVQDSVISCYDAYDSTAKLSGANNQNPTLDKTNDIIFYANEKISIPAEESFVGKITVKVSGKSKESTYNCAMVIEDPTSQGQEYARKEFIITVTEP
jgi:hypothetical protein